MTEAKVAETGRKQETTPQHGRMNLHLGAPLPPQNRPFLWLHFIPVLDFGIWDFGFTPWHHQDALEQSSKWYQRLYPGLL